MSDSTLARATFLDKLTAARRGESIVYHTGGLMGDRFYGGDFQKVHGVAIAAWDAYAQGVCILVQKTIGDGEHQYVAQKL